MLVTAFSLIACSESGATTVTTTDATAATTNASTVTLSEGLTTIDTDAFYGCTSLTEIEIPDSVTYKGTGVFMGCASLKSATLSSGMTRISNYTFSQCIIKNANNWKAAAESWQVYDTDVTDPQVNAKKITSNSSDSWFQWRRDYEKDN